MEAVVINPRQAAEALGVDLLTLGDTLRGWAAVELDRLNIGTDIEADGNDLERFDEAVARARQYVESFVAVEKAWREDNPDAFTEDDLEGRS